MKLSDFKKLRPGNRVLISERYLDFLDIEAYNLCKINDVLHEMHADSYFILKALGQDMPYTARVHRAINSPVDHDGSIGAVVSIKVGAISTTSVLSYKDIDLVRKKPSKVKIDRVK